MAEPLSDDQVRKRLAALDHFKKNAVGFAIWDMVINVTGGLHGGLDDWPAYIRDPIMKAIERDCIPEKPGYHIKVIASGCFQDVKSEPCYLRVIVQEFPPIVKR